MHPQRLKRMTKLDLVRQGEKHRAAILDFMRTDYGWYDFFQIAVALRMRPYAMAHHLKLLHIAGKVMQSKRKYRSSRGGRAHNWMAVRPETGTQ
jgi:predicted transcriptional regulator